MSRFRLTRYKAKPEQSAWLHIERTGGPATVGGMNIGLGRKRWVITLDLPERAGPRKPPKVIVHWPKQ